MNSGASKTQIKLVACYILYYILFQTLYQNWIVNVWGYQGYLNEFSLANGISSVLVLLALIFIVPTRFLPSSSFIHLIICIIMVPTLVLYSGQNISIEFLIITLSAVVLVIFTVRVVRVGEIEIPRVQNKVLMRTFLLLVLLNIGGILYFGGVEYLNFDFSKVYELRRDAEGKLPNIFGYFNSTAVKVLIPFGIVIAYANNKWFYVLCFFLCSILFFGLTQHKSPIFTPILVLLVLRFWDVNKTPIRVVLFLSVILLLSMLDMLWLSSSTQDSLAGWFTGLFANRTLLVPSALNRIYIEFFSSESKYYWSASKITLGFVDNPHGLSSANLIGLEVFGDADMSANTGWIGSGFANAGFFGVLFYSFLLGVWLSFLDAYSRKLGNNLVFALFFILVFTLVASTDFTDMLLTHGLLFALLILMLMNPPVNKFGS